VRRFYNAAFFFLAAASSFSAFFLSFSSLLDFFCATHCSFSLFFLSSSKIFVCRSSSFSALFLSHLLLLLLRLVPSPHQMAWGTPPPNIGDQHTVTISCKAKPALSHVVQEASMFVKDRT
jgi:hypothetical protein